MIKINRTGHEPALLLLINGKILISLLREIQYIPRDKTKVPIRSGQIE